MPRSRPEPWASYARWLTEERGVLGPTANNYISIARRVVRDVPTLTPETLDAYVASLPAGHRSPLRSAWRRFVEWSAGQDISVPTFTPYCAPVAAPLPVKVTAAIRVFRQDGVKATDMHRLRWNLETRAGLVALAPTRVWFKAPEGAKHDVFPVSRAAANALKVWAYGDTEPTTADPVVPRGPDDHRPMPVAAIRRVLSGRTR